MTGALMPPTWLVPLLAAPLAWRPGATLVAHPSPNAPSKRDVLATGPC